MDFFHGLYIITLVHTLAAVSPGPDFVFVSQQTLAHGRRAGLLASLGIALGLGIHIMYSAFGMAAVVAHSAGALLAIKLLGGSYLVYLGVKGLRSRPSGAALPTETTLACPSGLKSVGMGFLCNALNPKAPIYFVSLFTVVLSPDMPLRQLALYGLWMMFIQLLWFCLVALLLSRSSVYRLFRRCGYWIDRILGGAMVALGLKILATKAG